MIGSASGIYSSLYNNLDCMWIFIGLLFLLIWKIINYLKITFRKSCDYSTKSLKLCDIELTRTSFWSLKPVHSLNYTHIIMYCGCNSGCAYAGSYLKASPSCTGQHTCLRSLSLLFLSFSSLVSLAGGTTRMPLLFLPFFCWKIKEM